MANIITPATGLRNTDFVATTSRYLKSPIIYWSEQKVITFTTYKRTPTKASGADKFLLVTKGMEYRPDRVAQAAYGKSLIALWWRIMEANGIFDVFDLKAGITLRIPPVAN